MLEEFDETEKAEEDHGIEESFVKEVWENEEEALTKSNRLIAPPVLFTPRNREISNELF